MRLRVAFLCAGLLLTSHAQAEGSSPAPRVVAVRVVGEGLPRLEPSLRESLGRLALGVKLSRPAPTGSEDQPGVGVVARVWVEITESGAVNVLVLDESTGRVLERRELDARSDDLLEEQLTLLIRSALETGLGIPHEKRASIGSFEAVPSSSPEPAPSERPSEPRVVPVPEVVAPPPRPFGALDATRAPGWEHGQDLERPDGASRRGWSFGLEPGVSARWWSPDLPARRVVALSVSVIQRDFVGSPGVDGGFGYYEGAVSDTDALSFDLETREAWLLGRISLLERPSWEWTFASGPTLLWSQAVVRATAPGYAVSQPETHWDLVWRAQTGLRWWVQERLALGVTVGLDYDASTAAYGVSESGSSRSLASEGRLRPALGLSLGTEIGRIQ